MLQTVQRLPLLPPPVRHSGPPADFVHGYTAAAFTFWFRAHQRDANGSWIDLSACRGLEAQARQAVDHTFLSMTDDPFAEQWRESRPRALDQR